MQIVRGIVAAALCASLAACATPGDREQPVQPLAPTLPPATAPVDTAAIDTAALASGNAPGADLVGFPTTQGKDLTIEETTGPLKGYLTRFYKIRHVQGSQLIGILSAWKSEKGRIIDVPSHNMLIIT